MSLGQGLSNDPHIIGYIASALSSGVYDKIPRLEQPTTRELISIAALWYALHSNNGYRLEIFNFFRSHSNPRNTRAVVNQNMVGTIESLKVHSLSLEEDPHVDVDRSQLEDILKSATGSSPLSPSATEVDAEVSKLARWFKDDYMRWIDPAHCPKCDGPTTGVGSAEPTSAEREEGAGRVELHRCNDIKCGEMRRFCRYGKIKALIRSREGRCGEWAQLFYVFLRVRGIESRYVWNSEDHVWCEYWSPALRHWVHVDPCEAATNKPLLYARGWGKKQAFCLAFGRYGAEDVTRAYVDDWQECKNRRRARGWKEVELRRALYAHTVSIRLRMSLEERVPLEAMDQLQSRWMADESGRLAEAERMYLGGRISGPEDWRAMRDEMGLDKQEVKIPNHTVVRSLTVLNNGLIKYGTTRLTSSGILLTDGPSQTSSVFNPHPLDRDTDCRCKFKFRLTSPQSGEADGIALIFSSAMGLGLGGYGLGYDGLGQDGDFAIEIDTYRTQDHADDPPTPHISLHSPLKAHHKHSLGCTKPGSIPFLSDGRVYELEVIYRCPSPSPSSSPSADNESSTRRVQAYLRTPEHDILEVLDVSLPESEESSSGSKSENKKEWYVGISGACGGLWQKQEILDWQLDIIQFDDADTGPIPTDQSSKEKEAELETDTV
ncbi:uncharacterized protein I303_102818 [Kwoniella dejecticola CBS 10117]|uniref:Transglutaminase-like domain-containing protein n=1 Tax=Kwoniella dejecticola CBS 10117 TaxID=1296121 RepID=A0A1A6A9T0_9TREE|nr:uncharacterized protein I303_02832 [Kwoniella dejecticola CBS 10117]OBR86817.1 hypothetical protein I303_02832 [Kwoniella dejecticola CBS 10117]